MLLSHLVYTLPTLLLLNIHPILAQHPGRLTLPITAISVSARLFQMAVCDRTTLKLAANWPGVAPVLSSHGRWLIPAMEPSPVAGKRIAGHLVASTAHYQPALGFPVAAWRQVSRSMGAFLQHLWRCSGLTRLLASNSPGRRPSA